MHTMSVDIETYSPVDLAECGVYKYAEDPQTQVMLIAYAIDDGPVEVYDCATGDPEKEDYICDILVDPNVIKYAYNASFERQTLARWAVLDMPPEQWRDQLPEEMRRPMMLLVKARKQG